MNQFVVWMDGVEAKIFRLDELGFDESLVESPQHHVYRHPKDEQTRTHNHPDGEQRFFRAVGSALAGRRPILVVGPSLAKVRFLTYVHTYDHALESRIVHVETVDHPTNREIVALGRRYFAPAAPAA